MSEMAVNSKAKTLQLHLLDWCKCQRCPLGVRAFKHVMFSTYNFEEPRKRRLRSDPVDVMFIGEGPGEAEDAIGRPFIGPTGRFLRRECWPLAKPDSLIVMMANLVACRPQDKTGGPNRPPQPEEIETCRPRLVQLIELFDPLVIVALGRVPQQYVPGAIQKTLMTADSHWSGPLFELPHPSSISRKGGTKSEEFGPYIAKLASVFEKARSMKKTWRLG